MEDKNLNRVFDRVKLSPAREEAMLADLLNEKKEVSGMEQTNRRRIPAAPLAAAVLIAVLAGTAVAAEYFVGGKAKITPIEGDYTNGYQMQSDMTTIPPERLSEELLEHASQAIGKERFYFASLSEAEEFLGFPVPHNSCLEDMTQVYTVHDTDYTPEGWETCTVSMNYSAGLPDIIRISAGYIEDRFYLLSDIYARVGGPDPSITGYTIRNRISQASHVETYITPSGLEAAILTCDRTISTLDGGSFSQMQYEAYFVKDGFLFELETRIQADQSADQVLSTLKEILDAYE